MIEEVLEEIGLTVYETKVYIALLDLGESTTGAILNKAELKTGKIYEILTSLENKGLVSKITINGVKKFSPADPRRVYDLLEKHKKELEEQEKNFKNIVPKLLDKIKSKKKPINIEIFTGINGLKTAYSKEKMRYSPKNPIYVLGVLPREAYSKASYDFFLYNIYPSRERSKAQIKKIYSESARKDKGMQEKGAKMKYIPYDYNLNINIVGDLTTIGLAAGEQEIYISIESEEVAQGFIKQFELLWKIAKK